jgi:phenylalanyl-tRNA synthetase beta chain
MDPLSKYPGSERDWTVTLDEKMPIGDVLSQVKSIPSRLLQNVTLRYLYRSEKIGSDKKNATFHFLYRDSEKTLAQEAVEAEHTKIIDETIKNLNL